MEEEVRDPRLFLKIELLAYRPVTGTGQTDHGSVSVFRRCVWLAMTVNQPGPAMTRDQVVFTGV